MDTRFINYAGTDRELSISHARSASDRPPNQSMPEVMEGRGPRPKSSGHSGVTACHECSVVNRFTDGPIGPDSRTRVLMRLVDVLVQIAKHQLGRDQASRGVGSA